MFISYNFINLVCLRIRIHVRVVSSVSVGVCAFKIRLILWITFLWKKNEMFGKNTLKLIIIWDYLFITKISLLWNQKFICGLVGLPNLPSTSRPIPSPAEPALIRVLILDLSTNPPTSGLRMNVTSSTSKLMPMAGFSLGSLTCQGSSPWSTP